VTEQIFAMPAPAYAELLSSVDLERLGVAWLFAAVVLSVEAAPREYRSSRWIAPRRGRRVRRRPGT